MSPDCREQNQRLGFDTWWRIPAERMKMKQLHIVPLSTVDCRAVGVAALLRQWRRHLLQSPESQGLHEREHHALCPVPHGVSVTGDGRETAWSSVQYSVFWPQKVVSFGLFCTPELDVLERRPAGHADAIEDHRISN